MKRIIMIAALCAISSNTFAQTNQSWDASFWKLWEKQTHLALDEPHDEIRAQSLRNVVILASSAVAAIDSERLTSRIIRLLEAETNPEVRIPALAALRALGTRTAARYIESRPNKVEMADARAVMLEILDTHYEARLQGLNRN
jgi:HEAT repeat protein